MQRWVRGGGTSDLSERRDWWRHGLIDESGKTWMDGDCEAPSLLSGMDSVSQSTTFGSN
jgi:hypothetical protein